MSASIQSARAISGSCRIGENTHEVETEAPPREAFVTALADPQPASEALEAQAALAAEREAAGDLVAATRLRAALIENALKAGRRDWIEPAVAALARGGAEPRVMVVLANLLRVGGHQDLAIRLLDSVLRERPNDIPALLTRAMACLAIVHGDEAEIVARRQAYAFWLRAAARAVERAAGAERAAAADVVGAAKPFFLAYQGLVNRELQALYGRIVVDLLQATGLGVQARARPRLGSKIRVAFVSHYFYTHSVLKLFRGWMLHLDRARFEVQVFHVGSIRDAMTDKLAASVDAFHFGPRAIPAWIEAINQAAPHAIVYPEIGMDQTTVALAALRLASVQCVAWGHPETTGLPTIDYFLTCDAMEPEDAETHYTEKLVRLPSLSVHYQRLPCEGGRLKRSDLGLGATDIVYVCCQSLFKYLPRHDALFVEIARRVPTARFLFLGPAKHPLTLQFGRRIEAAFRAGGLDPRRHVVLAAMVPYPLFPSLLRLGDVYLDSVGWSGFNTTLEAIACDLPVVTWPEGPMRGRHSAAALARMGLEDFIARDAPAYVNLAAALADANARAAASRRFAAARNLLYGDETPVRALETFLIEAVAAANAPRADTARLAS